MSAIDIILYTVLPITGCFLVLGLACSPIQQLRECLANNELGAFNPLPPCLFFLTNLVWIFMGLLVEDIYIVIINCIMLSVNLQITLKAYGLADQDTRRTMEYFIQFGLALPMILSLHFMYGDLDLFVVMYGWLCCAYNMAVFVPPIIFLHEITITKDASVISAPFAFAGVICTSFWCFYAILIEVYAMAIPNGFGLLLSIIQLMFVIVYPGIDQTQNGDKSLLNETDIEVVVKIGSVVECV